MRRRLVTPIAVALGVWLVGVPAGRGPSVEDIFVATTEAAAEGLAAFLERREPNFS